MNQSPSQLKNSFWHLLDVVSYPVLFLILTPVFITALGLEDYGILIFLNTALAISSLLDFGAPPTLTHLQAKFRLETTLFKKSLLIGLVSSSVAWIIWFFLFESKGIFLLLNFGSDTTVNMLFFTGAFLFLCRYLENNFIGLVRGFKRFDISAKYNLMHRNLGLTIQAAIAVYTQEIGSVLLSKLIWNLVSFLWLFFKSKRIIHQFTISNKRIRWIYFWRYSKWYWVQNWLSVTVFQGDKIWVLALFGNSILSIYAIGSAIGMNIHMALSAINTSMVPKIAELKITKSGTSYVLINLTAIMVLGILPMMIIYKFTPFLVEQWLNIEQVDLTTSIIQGFLIFEMFYALTIVPNQFLNARSYLKESSLLEALVKLVLIGSILFLPQAKQSGFGVVQALIIGSAVGIPIYLFSFHRIIKDRMVKMLNLSSYGITMLFFIGAIFHSNYIYVGILLFLVLTIISTIKNKSSFLQLLDLRDRK